METLSDEKLMVRFQRGEMRAFEVLLGRHRRGVFNFVYRFAGAPDEAEDLLQEVFMRLVAARDTFARRSKFTTWLYTIARNLCIDELRKRRHRNHLSLDQPRNPGDESEVCLMDRVRTDDPAPDRAAHNVRLREHIQRAVGALTEEQREVFLMREEAGMPFDEIAQVVGAPLNTVKSRMRYALQNLRANLEEQGVTL